MKESVKKIKVGYTWCTVFVLINSFFERLAYYGTRSEFLEISNTLCENFKHFCLLLFNFCSIATLSLQLKNSQGFANKT
jgi:hypothetical protein